MVNHEQIVLYYWKIILEAQWRMNGRGLKLEAGRLKKATMLNQNKDYCDLNLDSDSGRDERYLGIRLHFTWEFIDCVKWGQLGFLFEGQGLWLGLLVTQP